MADVAESKVTGIIKSLNGLEDDLDSLTGKVGDMKKQLNVKTLSESDEHRRNFICNASESR